MRNNHLKHLFWLALATLFISTSGSLGKYIYMPTPIIIWWRSALAALFLLAYCLFKKADFKLNSKKDRLPFLLSALFMGAHWLTYFHALKLSNVAIGMLSLFTFPIITTLLEPFFDKVKFDPVNLILALSVLAGIYILAPAVDFENTYFQGLLWGLISALCYALRNLILKQHVSKYNGTVLMVYQVSILAIVMLPVLLFMDGSTIKTQFPYVILLALLTTAIGHSLFVNSLKYFKVSTASIIGSAQPVFGIALAYVFLNEIPTWHTFWGGLLILIPVVIESIRSKNPTDNKDSY